MCVKACWHEDLSHYGVFGLWQGTHTPHEGEGVWELCGDTVCYLLLTSQGRGRWWQENREGKGAISFLKKQTSRCRCRVLHTHTIPSKIKRKKEGKNPSLDFIMGVAFPNMQINITALLSSKLKRYDSLSLTWWKTKIWDNYLFESLPILLCCSLKGNRKQMTLWEEMVISKTLNNKKHVEVKWNQAKDG